jgi:hypothetical protein
MTQEKPDLNEIAHYGILGMKWGTRHGRKAADRLGKRIDNSIKKFDSGSRRVTAGTFREHSRKARKLTYKANKRIARMNKYLSQVKDEPANNLILKWKKNPQKVAKVKEYLNISQMETKKLSELRTSLMDVKLDLI